MTNVSNVLAPVEALPDEVDSQKRHWLQAFHPSVEQVTAPQVQDPASPESIGAIGGAQRVSAATLFRP